jgi:hypothetical protein
LALHGGRERGASCESFGIGEILILSFPAWLLNRDGQDGKGWVGLALHGGRERGAFCESFEIGEILILSFPAWL